MVKSYQYLRYATIAVIIGTIYVFVLRSYGAVVARMFDSQIAVQITQVLAFVASAIHVMFFYLFFRDYCRDDQQTLKNAALGAVIGSGIHMLLYFRGLSMVFNMHEIYVRTRSIYIEILFPFIGAFLITIFFVVLRQDVVRRQHQNMMKPALAGLVGSAIQMCLVMLIMLNYLCVRHGFLAPDVYRMVGIFLIPVLILQLMAYVYFYSSFYKELKLASPHSGENKFVIQE